MTIDRAGNGLSKRRILRRTVAVGLLVSAAVVAAEISFADASTTPPPPSDSIVDAGDATGDVDDHLDDDHDHRRRHRRSDLGAGGSEPVGSEPAIDATSTTTTDVSTTTGDSTTTTDASTTWSIAGTDTSTTTSAPSGPVVGRLPLSFRAPSHPRRMPQRRPPPPHDHRADAARRSGRHRAAERADERQGGRRHQFRARLVGASADPRRHDQPLHGPPVHEHLPAVGPRSPTSPALPARST